MDIGGALRRSLALGAVVMVLTVLLSLLAGLAYRKKLPGGTLLFYVVVASLIMPSIIVSLGIGLMFRLFDGALKSWLEVHAPSLHEGFNTLLGIYTSGLGAQLTWTLPFGLLIMFAVFNRFNPAYEEAARDLGATPWQSLRHVDGNGNAVSRQEVASVKALGARIRDVRQGPDGNLYLLTDGSSSANASRIVRLAP